MGRGKRKQDSTQHKAWRQCLGCRVKKPQSVLRRIQLGAEGLECVRQSNQMGRSVYVCANQECCGRGQKSVTRSLRLESLELEGDAIWRMVQHSEFS